MNRINRMMTVGCGKAILRILNIPVRSVLRFALYAGIVLAATCASAQEPIKDQVRCYTTWDDHYFYAAFRVDCPDVRGTHKTPNAEVTGDDAVSIYIQASDKVASSVTPGCFSLTVSAAGGARFSAGNDKGVLEPVPVWAFKYGAFVQGTLNNNDDVDQGFSVEMAIPWELMKTKPAQLGDMMRFNVVLRRHDAKSGDFVSLSSKISTEEDVLNPSKWLSLVYASYSFGAVMPGGDKLITSKSLVRPPLVNGLLDVTEWSKNALFAIDLPTPEGFVYEAKYPVQRLVFTPYYYWYQADPRKTAPLAHFIGPDGAVQLQDFPIKGAGPWFSSDRVQWHKEQMTDIVAAGIDVVLPVYWGDKQSRAAYASKGLDCMIAAIAELRAEGRSYPHVAMLFDMAAMRLAYAGKQPDLNDEEAKRTFYGMVKDFYDRVPLEFRAFAQSGKPNAGRPGCLVIVSADGRFVDVEEGCAKYAGERFERDFGCPLIWSASDGSKGKSGEVRLAFVSAGFDDSAVAQQEKIRVVSRMAGETYEKDWEAALSSNPQWMVCGDWNDFQRGSDLCASREYGRKYIDATLASTKRFTGAIDIDVQCLRCDMPRVIPPRSIAQAEIVLRNEGNVPWRAAEGYVLAYRWYQRGRYIGESKVRRPLEKDVSPGETVLLDIGVATVGEKNQAMAEGDYEVRFEIVRVSDGKWFSALGAQPLIVPVTIGKADQPRAAYLTCDAPVMMASGPEYPVKARVRNESTQIWRKGAAKMSCRLYRVANYKHDDPNELSEEIPAKAVRGLLQRDCKPGEIAEFVFPLSLVRSDGKPVASWSPDQPWSYQLQFDVYNGQNWLSELGSAPLSRTVDIFDSDCAARIVDSNIPAKLSAGQVFDAKVVIRNAGAVTWDRKRTKIGYHWFHLDGTQMQWDCPATPIAADIKPGWPVVTTAKMKAPEYDGRYVLAWDVQIDGIWSSTLPLTRGGDLLPVFVEVTSGKLAFADLSSVFDVSAASPDTNRTAGDFDGKGLSFPAEYLPPDAGPVEAPSRVYPSGYKWDREPRPDGRISFVYPDKLGGANSAVACAGQKIAVDRAKCVAVHVLGASSNGEASGDVTLNYTEGPSTAPLAMSGWTGGPKLGEGIGYVVRHVHSHGGDETGKRGYLYHYTIPLDRARTLTGITLPRNADMKIVAITVERVSLLSPASP